MQSQELLQQLLFVVLPAQYDAPFLFLQVLHFGEKDGGNVCQDFVLVQRISIDFCQPRRCRVQCWMCMWAELCFNLAFIADVSPQSNQDSLENLALSL